MGLISDRPDQPQLPSCQG